MTSKHVFTAVIVGILLIAASRGDAADCGPVVRDLLAHQGGFDATVVAMNDGAIASYSKMVELKKVWSRPTVKPPGAPLDALRGQGKQLFNDRVRPSEQPFTVTRSDDLQFELTSAPLVTFTLLSWNKGKISFTPSCDGGLVHGWSPGGRTYYVIHILRNDVLR